jgi:hypothetical protein
MKSFIAAKTRNLVTTSTPVAKFPDTIQKVNLEKFLITDSSMLQVNYVKWEGIVIYEFRNYS